MLSYRDKQLEFEYRFQNPQHFDLGEFSFENKIAVEGVEDDTVCYESPEIMADYCDSLLSEGIGNITALEIHLQLIYSGINSDQRDLTKIFRKATEIKELIRDEQDFLVFVENKKKSTVKYTRYRAAAERYVILEKFGLFKSPEWRMMSVRNKQKWLSEILYCNIDTAKNIMNGKKDYQIGPSNKEKIIDKIRQDQKKG
jgi:hypothetical protein